MASAAASVLVFVGVVGSGMLLAGPAQAAPAQPYERLLPLELSAPSTAQAGQPLTGVSVRLHNPGNEAPSSRLRLIIHDTDHRYGHVDHELNPDNVKVEVREEGVWKPVVLEVMEGGVMGAIGGEGGADHRERHRRGGFVVNQGFDKRWSLRVTFGLPGSYTLLVAVSPDNGSTHIAQPAHTSVEVQR